MFLTPISLQNSTNTSSSTYKTNSAVKLQRIECKAGLKRAVCSVSLTRFMRSRRSVISRSRDWIILLMSLMRGPKFASSLSSLDFSCKQEVKQKHHQQQQKKHLKTNNHYSKVPKDKTRGSGRTCMLRERCLVLVCSRSLWEYLSLICRPCA